MRIKSYGWLDDYIVGDVIIECDCGHILRCETLDGENSENKIECPVCKKSKKFRLSINMTFENID